MAVTLKKKSLTLVSLVERLFTAEAVAGGIMKDAVFLHQYGCTLHVTPKIHSIVSTQGNVLHKVPLTASAVALALKKQLGAAAIEAIRAKIEKLIITASKNLAMAGVGAGPTKKDINLEMEKIANAPAYLSPDVPAVKSLVMEVYADPSVLYGSKIAAIKKLRELTNISLKQAKDLVESWIAAIPHSAETGLKMGEGLTTTTYSIGLEYADPAGPVVDLAMANQLHQPVKGTSPNARYHVVALRDDCAVAARVKADNNISIRALCTAQPNSNVAKECRSGIMAAGLKKCPQGHWSLHLTPGTMALVKRSLGSTLFAMGIQFNAVSSNIEPLMGAGK